MSCVEALRKKFKRLFSSGNGNDDRGDVKSSSSKKKKKDDNNGIKDNAKSSSNNCCCAGKNCCGGGSNAIGDDNEIVCVVNVNPYSAPIDEIVVDAIDKKKRKKKKKMRSKDKGSKKIHRILQRFTCSSSSSSKGTRNQTTLSSSSLQPLELTSSSSQSRNRYKREYHELDLIGTGEFGSVYRCINRLDGCIYAIKRSRPLARSNYAQRRAKNEVHANAVLNNHPNVVRYYSAWIEDDRMSMQQEYCNGGDLNALLVRMRRDGEDFDEVELCRLMVQLAEGLRYVHGSKLAHMDLKPENVFITRERTWTRNKRCDNIGEPGGDDDQTTKDYHFEEQMVYKIGDLGHVASLVDTVELEDEGDCRFLPREILREDYSDLAKADVFALGLTMYEVAGGGPLPKNGPDWHRIRDGELSRLGRYSDEFNELLRAMTHPDPKKRPSATDLLRCEFLYNGHVELMTRAERRDAS